MRIVADTHFLVPMSSNVCPLQSPVSATRTTPSFQEKSDGSIAAVMAEGSWTNIPARDR